MTNPRSGGKKIAGSLRYPRRMHARDEPPARVASLQVSDGGVPKRPVESARVGRLGLAGDRQAHPRFHGGPDRAVCLFSAERIEALRAEGHPIEPGSTGENVTVRGLDWSRVVPGARLRFALGPQLEVTGYAQPCQQIRAAFADGAYQRILQDRHPGSSRVYARVLADGELRVGQAVELRAP